MKLNIKKISVSFVASLALSFSLTGCGGGGGNSSSSSTSSSSGGQTLSGKVADGYLVGAKVCLDTNSNGVCDTTEPSTITTTGGEYSLTNLSSSQIDKYNLVVHVFSDTIDEDDGLAVGGNYILSAPKKVTFISPLSTMINEHMKQNSSTYNSSLNQISSDLNIPSTNLKEDYVSEGLSSVHEKAKIIANLLKNIRTNVSSSSNNYENQDISEYINRVVLSKLSLVNSELDKNGFELNTNISNIMSAINTDAYISDIASIATQRIENKNTYEANSTSLEQLSSSSEIKQNQKYSFVYKGGTVLRNFTVENSVNKVCTINILDTTSTYSPYGKTYSFNYAGYTQKNSVSISGTNKSNATFSLMWYYYTSVDSHVDFYVSCLDRDTLFQDSKKALITKTGLDIPQTYSSSSNWYVFNKSGKTAYDGNKQFYWGNNRIDNLDSFYYSGLAISFDGVAIKSYERDQLKIEDVNRIDIEYMPKTQTATVVLKNANDEILDEFTKLMPLSITDPQIKFSVNTVKLENQNDSILHVSNNQLTAI